MYTIYKYAVLLLIILFVNACSQDHSVSTDPVEEYKSIETPKPIEGAVKAKQSFLTNWADAELHDFEDLIMSCSWDHKFPDPYHELDFVNTAKWALCRIGTTYPGMSGLAVLPADSVRENLKEVKMNLPQPADKARIATLNFRNAGSGYYTSFIAYDELGNEIDRQTNADYYYDSSTGTINSTVLTVGDSVSTRIHTLGIESYQGVTYLDNLEIVYDSDTTAPQINYSLASANLWPANRKMILSVGSINAVDDYDPDPIVSVMVNSNESMDAGSSAMADWEIRENSNGTFDVFLRAEQSRRGNTRIYRVHITSSDESGNSSQAEIEVKVARN